VPTAIIPLQLATNQFKWFYWVGPLLGLGLILMVGMLVLGYYVKVLRPKWKGRQVQ
jgi:hypothetical protein